MADYIKGINVGNLIETILSKGRSGDLDIIDNYSDVGGVRQPDGSGILGPLYGPTATGSGTTGSQTGTATQSPTQSDPITPSPTGERQWTAADERVYYADQIANLNKLLGLTGTQLTTGLNNLGVQRGRLADSRTKAMGGYDNQALENEQAKQKGVGEVDTFANNSFNSLQRLLQGAGAGNSSAARSLVPYLISKGAGSRRTGVFDTAGRNARDIDMARGEAEDQFKLAGEDIDSSEKSFREGILNKQNEIGSQIRDLQIKSAMADGTGYEAAKAAGATSQSGIDARIAELNTLFGNFNPTHRSVNLRTPELGKYTVDPGQIRSDNTLPAESSYYMSQLRKRKEQE